MNIWSKGRPERGDLKVDQILIISEGSGRSRRTYVGRITKVARVWVTVVNTDVGYRWKEWRLRMDDQSDGSQYSYGARFETQEQHDWRMLQEETAEYLRLVGIIDTRTLKVDPVALATAIKKIKESE